MTDTRAPRQGPGQAAGPAEPTCLLVGCSRDRTLVARFPHGGGPARLVKIYEGGSLEDARQEARIGVELQVAGLVRYREACLDEVSGRPCVVMDYHEGKTLAEWLACHGPLRPRAAAAVTLRLARTLRELARATSPAAPRGAVHRDVKPENILLVGPTPDPEKGPILLLDLEHAIALDSAPDSALGGASDFSGGTHGFAPPEAYLGADPTTGFDVFALGATLFAALTGRHAFCGRHAEEIAAAVRAHAPRLEVLNLLPRELAELVRACLAPVAAVRPSLEEIATRLETWLEGRDEPTRDPACDRALEALWSADLERAERLLAAAPRPPEASRHAALQELLARRRRLLERLETFTTPPIPESLAARVEFLAREIPSAAAWLRRFPLQREALDRKARLRLELDAALREVPPAVADHKRTARFAEAVTLLQAALAAVTTAAEPPSLSSTRVGRAPTPGPLQRDPESFLRAALRDVLSAAETHEALLEKLRTAEAALDLRAAGSILNDAARAYSGANEVVAGLKDRLHLLQFHVERIAQPMASSRSLREQLEIAEIEIDLQPLSRLRRRCASRLDSPPSPNGLGPGGGLRSLQRSLHDLLEGFPHTAGAVTEGTRALDAAMASLTELSWSLLANARSMLEAVPIPIRPLQGIINRVDSLRILEVLVDRPEGSRAAILDELEQVRMRVDQARATRDHIARGAEEAMRKGHLTTALYDMARAVDRFDDDAETEELRLATQLQRARHVKAELEQATGRSMELATRYARLRDDAASAFEDRLDLLEERKQALSFLAEHLHAERAALYAGDLREVRVAIVSERAEHAETRLDRAESPAARLQIATSLLTEIERELAEMAAHSSPPGRVERIFAHWQHQRDRAAAELEESRAKEQQAIPLTRPLVLATRLALLLASLLAVAALIRTLV